MYPISIDMQLPLPWKHKRFSVKKIPFLTCLVGSNGTGKSRFIESLKPHLPAPRILGADRLTGLLSRELRAAHWIVGGSQVDEGFSKSQFEVLKQQAGVGFGADAFILLEENFDLRIKVEATLSQCLGRQLILEWDAGRLVPKGRNVTFDEMYELQRECHGIKELIVLLTHLYHDKYKTLIIDEPELNLHPQYQAFVLNEIKKIAGNPNEAGKKIIILVTHSPFMLDIKTAADLASIICFHSNFDAPSHLLDMSDAEINSFSSIVARLNVHHKQLFFADRPVFVEGIFDAQMIQAIQERRGVSVCGSGSCIIDAGGNEEVSLYFQLCGAYRKEANFVYDLDSIFSGGLRRTAGTDALVLDFLAKIGAGDYFNNVCGDLEAMLSEQIKSVMASPVDCNNADLKELKEFFSSEIEIDTNSGGIKSKNKDSLKKCRVAYLVHLSLRRKSLDGIVDQRAIALAEGKLRSIIEALKSKGVYLLKDGALEHYLPSYKGSPYIINKDTKKATVDREMAALPSIAIESMPERYGYLFQVILELPASPGVNYKSTITSHIAVFIFKMQEGVRKGFIKNLATLAGTFKNEWEGYIKVFSVDAFEVYDNGKFTCVISVNDRWGLGPWKVTANESTNAGMANF